MKRPIGHSFDSSTSSPISARDREVAPAKSSVSGAPAAVCLGQRTIRGRTGRSESCRRPMRLRKITFPLNSSRPQVFHAARLHRESIASGCYESGDGRRASGSGSDLGASPASP